MRNWPTTWHFSTNRPRRSASSRPSGMANEQAWADLCHVLFNVKEFIFIN